MNRYRVNRKEETVDIMDQQTGHFSHYKRFDELTKREYKKAQEFYVYNLKAKS